jgi:signal transduction histidine kinase
VTATKKLIEGERVPERLDSDRKTRVERLLETITNISSTLDINSLLDVVLQAVLDLTDCEASSILFLDSAGGHLYFAAATGPNPPDKDTLIPVDTSLAGWVLRESKPLIVKDAADDDRYFADIEHYTNLETHNLVAVPLIGKRESIGSLEAVNKKDGGDFDDIDMLMLEALAAQASVAIENARLFQQTDLIAEFMHELKTPLLALTAASEILSRDSDSLSLKHRELFEMVERETAHLSQMAQEFLELARLESGRTQLIYEDVDLGELVAEVVRLEEPQATSRNIDLEMNIPVETRLISGDRGKLKRVLVNLVSNAVKYNVEYGTVAVNLQMANGSAIIEVSDTGPGIPDEDIPHLFERFYRVPDEVGFTEGTGLGLTIASRIIEEHGGKIEVESVLGEGSCFRCILPVKQKE